MTNALKQRVHVFSWADIDGIVSNISRYLDRFPIDHIVGISRSGLVPAVMLSHHLGVRPLSAINIMRTLNDEIYAEKTDPQYGEMQDLKHLREKNVLLIDDIVGTGLTLRKATELLKLAGCRPTTATLVVNQENLGDVDPAQVVDIVGSIVHGWVVFPWEAKS